MNIRASLAMFWKRLQWLFVAQIALWAVFCVLPFNASMPLGNDLFIIYWPGARLLNCLIPRRLFFLGNIPLGVASILFTIVLYSIVSSLAFGAALVLRQFVKGPKKPVHPHLP